MFVSIKPWALLSAVLLSILSQVHGQAAEATAPAAHVANTGVSADAAPTQMALLDDDWELQIGDRLVYQVMEEQEEELLLAVNGNGELLVPLLGSIAAKGKTSKGLAYEIKKELEVDFFYRATVLISQREADRNRGRVKVIGQVNRQGEQLIPADSPLTLSQAILASGGFTLHADQSKVSVVSAGQEDPRIEVDLGAMLSSGDLSQDLILSSGDVVIVAQADHAGSQVYVLGAVNAPGLYSIRGSQFTLSQVILMAEGFTRFARKNKVRLVSKNEKGEKTESLVNVDKILDGGDRSNDPIVKPGDMIIVDEKMISFTG
jgi:polysaccharide export outer membrane protein